MSDENYGTINALYEKIEFLEEHLKSYKELLSEQKFISFEYKQLIQELFDKERMKNDKD